MKPESPRPRPARQAHAFTRAGALGLAALLTLGAAPTLATPSKTTGSSPSSAAAAASRSGTASSAADKAKAAARKATSAAGAAAAAAATTLALASDEQRHAYSLAHLGEYQCEFKRMIRVLAHPRQEGYVDLHFDKQVVTARPVLSSTGAVRLEDVKGRYLMVQIAFKSMLMDTRIGQRVADECLHDAHHEARRAAAEAPPAEGLGITAPAAPAHNTR